jgi:hypothetical protein
MRRGRAFTNGSILTLFELSSLFTYSCKRASARPRFSRAPADVSLIGPQPMPQFLRTALGTTAHRCLLPYLPCLAVIGRPRLAALPVLSLASELSPPPLWPCNPQLHLRTFHRIEHSLITYFGHIFPMVFMTSIQFRYSGTISVPVISSGCGCC